MAPATFAAAAAAVEVAAASSAPVVAAVVSMAYDDPACRAGSSGWAAGMLARAAWLGVKPWVKKLEMRIGICCEAASGNKNC